MNHLVVIDRLGILFCEKGYFYWYSHNLMNTTKISFNRHSGVEQIPGMAAATNHVEQVRKRWYCVVFCCQLFLTFFLAIDRCR